MISHKTSFREPYIIRNAKRGHEKQNEMKQAFVFLHADKHALAISHGTNCRQPFAMQK